MHDYYHTDIPPIVRIILLLDVSNDAKNIATYTPKKFKNLIGIQMEAIKRDMKELADGACSSTSGLMKNISQAANDATKVGEEYHAEIKKDSKEAVTALETYVSKNPLKSILFSAGAGMIISRLMKQV